MADILTIAGSLAGIAKTVSEIAAAGDAAKRNSLLIEFQQAIIQANSITATEQARNSSLVARNQELEAECVRLKDWQAEASKYELVQISTGVFACLQKQRVGVFQSIEKLCCNCFNQGIKSPLQQSIEEMRRKGLNCHRCKSKMVFNSYEDQRTQQP